MGVWGRALLKLTIPPEPFIPFYTEMLSLVIFLNMIDCIHQPANETIKSVLTFTTEYFSFNAPYGLSIYAISLLLLLIAFSSHIKSRLLFLLSATAMILSPFLMNAIIGGFLPPRAMNCLAISFAASGVIVFSLYPEKKILWAVLVIVLIYGTASSSKLSYTDYLS